MFTRPTTEQVLRGLVDDLSRTIAPELTSETAKVALGMIVQLLQGCAVRSAHEIAWMHDEIAAIEAEVGTVAAAHGDSLHLEDVIVRYHAASEVLAEAVEAGYAAGDEARVDRLRALLEARSGNEMRIVGALDLVGRG